MKPAGRLAAVALACAAMAALAQDGTEYSLNEGQVRFRVPPGWSAVMEKTEGNPQAVAFQVPDETARGSDDSATVTVKSRRLSDPSGFDGFRREEAERARAQPGYENDGARRDAAADRYFVQRAKTRYHVQDSYHLAGSVAVQVRCQRPLLDGTPAGWNAQFDGACDGVVASLKR